MAPSVKLAYARRVCIPAATNIDLFSSKSFDIPEIVVQIYRPRTCVRLDDRDHQIVQYSVTVLVEVHCVGLGSPIHNCKPENCIATSLRAVQETCC